MSHRKVVVCVAGLSLAAGALAACLAALPACSSADDTPTPQRSAAAQRQASGQEAACEGQLAAPAADATHRLDRTLPIKGANEPYALASFCLAADGNLLVCLARQPELRVISPAGGELATWKLPFQPHSLCMGPEGTVYVGGGDSQAAKLDKTGAVLKTTRLPAGQSGYHRVASLAVDGRDLYVAFRNEGGFTLYRFDLDFGNPQQVLKGQRGCCGQFDVAVRGGVIYVADNTRHRIARFGREGDLLGACGQRSRDASDLEGFGSCCNPMNLCLAPDGTVYASESGVGLIKRFTPDGKYLGLAGSYQTKVGCKHVGVAVRPDGGEMYVIDVGESVIRAFKPVAPPAPEAPIAGSPASDPQPRS